MVWYITIVVIIAERFHLFPYRTQKLSFLTPKVLVGTLTGRIGHRHFPSFCRLFDKNNRKYCSLAQSVEHRTVNPSVVSSSLTGAAMWIGLEMWTIDVQFQGLFFYKNVDFPFKTLHFCSLLVVENLFQTEHLFRENLKLAKRTN